MFFANPERLVFTSGYPEALWNLGHHGKYRGRFLNNAGRFPNDTNNARVLGLNARTIGYSTLTIRLQLNPDVDRQFPRSTFVVHSRTYRGP